MRRGLPAGTVLDRITTFAGTRDYSFVVIDEAQDLNPTHYELFVTGPRRAQQRIAHALVGDPFQSLYAWRGAKNALRDAKATLQHTLIRLTKSFRFGEEVADLATAVLQRCGDPATARVVGCVPPERIASITGTILTATIGARARRSPCWAEATRTYCWRPTSTWRSISRTRTGRPSYLSAAPEVARI